VLLTITPIKQKFNKLHDIIMRDHMKAGDY